MTDTDIVFEFGLDGHNGEGSIEVYDNCGTLNDHEWDDEFNDKCYDLGYNMIERMVEKKMIQRDLETFGHISIKDDRICLDYKVCTGLTGYPEEDTWDEYDLEKYKIWVDIIMEFPISDLDLDPKYQISLLDIRDILSSNSDTPKIK